MNKQTLIASALAVQTIGDEDFRLGSRFFGELLRCFQEK
jgi:hypothetical protein